MLVCMSIRIQIARCSKFVNLLISLVPGGAGLERARYCYRGTLKTYTKVGVLSDDFRSPFWLSRTWYRSRPHAISL